MISLHDIVHVPLLDPWFDRIAAEPSGLVVVAGVGGEGPSGVLGILFRQLLVVARPDGRPRRAVAIGGRVRFVRAERSRESQVSYLRTTGSKPLTYAEALEQATAAQTDLVVLEELNPSNLNPALEAAARGCSVLAALDTLLVGGQVLGFLADLGAPPDLLAHVGWIVGVQRLPGVCPHCGQAWSPSPADWQALGLEAPEGAGGRFRRNLGCPACEGNASPALVNVFDVFRHDMRNGSPAGQVHRPSEAPLPAYAFELARQGHIPLPEVCNLELNVLRRAQGIVLRKQRELARSEAELRAKVAALEASHRVLLNSTQALISLQDVTQTLAAASDRDVAARILHHARETMDADLVALYLIEEDGSGQIAAVAGWRVPGEGVRIPPAQVQWWLARGAQEDALSLAPHEWPPRVLFPGDRERVRAGLVLVLTANALPVGLLFAHSTIRRGFAIGERNVLQMFADQAAVAIQRRRLVAELRAKIEALEQAQAEIVNKERLERELELAREIQESFLPTRFPSFPGLQLAARSVPARAVGGDFYDVFSLRAGRVGVVVGDVSDKGMPAALFMALTRSLLRAEAQREGSPAAVLASVNRLLLQMSDSGMFVTALYGIVDLQRGELVYARAGHERPLHYRAADGACHPLPGAGVALGILSRITLTEEIAAIQPGDEIVLYTDGVTDELLPDGQPYGHERLAQAIESSQHLEVEGQCEALFAEMAALRGRAEPFDDAAVLLLRVGLGNDPGEPAGNKKGSPDQGSRLG